MKKTIVLLAFYFCSACVIAGQSTNSPSPASPAPVTTSGEMATSVDFTLAPQRGLTPVSRNVSIFRLKMLDENTGWAEAALPDGSDRTTHLLHTSDGGFTWEDVSPQNNPTICAYDFVDAKQGWLVLGNPSNAAEAVLLHTNDGGRTWQEISESIVCFYNTEIHFQDENSGWLWIGNPATGFLHIQLFLTDDGGVSWRKVTIPGPWSSYPDDSLTICGNCGDSFYFDLKRTVRAFGDLGSGNPSGVIPLSVSTDSGQSWRNMELPLPSTADKGDLIAPGTPVFFDQGAGLMPIELVDTQSGNYTRQLAFYSTRDGGDSWTASPAILQEPERFRPIIDMISTTDIVVIFGDRFYSSHDGTRTWMESTLEFEAANPGTSIRQIEFASPLTGWLILGHSDGSTSLWKTSDGGKTWDEIEIIVNNLQ